MTKRRKHGRIVGHRQPGVFTHPSQVPGTISRVRGEVRLKGPVPITRFKETTMADMAVKFGYIKEGQTVEDIPRSKMDDFARDLVKTAYGNRVGQGGAKDRVIIIKNSKRPRTKVLKVHR